MLEFCLALSMHFLEGDWNETHPCVRYTDNGWTAGAYLNSEDAISKYVSYTFGDEWFAEVGLVTGYSGWEVVPMLRAGYNFNDNVSAFIAPAATIQGEYGVVVGFEISRSLFDGSTSRHSPPRKREVIGMVNRLINTPLRTSDASWLKGHVQND